MIDIKASNFPAVKIFWIFIANLVDKELTAVNKQRQIAAESLTISWGTEQFGKNGLAMYSPKVKAMIACIVN